MTKKLLTALAGLVAVGSAVTMRAQAPAAAPAAAAPSYSLTATATAVSEYMFRGQRLGGASWQPAVEFATGDLTLGVWSNFPFKDKVKDSSDPEFDLYGSYTFNISKELSIVPGFTFYDYPKAPTNLGYYRSSFEPSIALNYTLADIKFTPKVYYDVVLEGPTYELNVAYAYPLKDLGTELDFSAQMGTFIQKDVVKDGNPGTKSWGEYWLLGVSAPFQITKQSKFTIGVAYTSGRNDFIKTGNFGKVKNPLEDDRTVVTASYSFSF